MVKRMTEQIAVRVSIETKRKLEQLAKKENRRLTEMARILIEKELKKVK